MITITDKGAEKVHEFLASQDVEAAGLPGLRVGEEQIGRAHV